MTSNSNRAASRKSRVFVFHEFIQEQYIKANLLSAGDVVLDCAGGKGDLSWLLCNADGVRSICVDPRIQKSKHIVKSIGYLRNNPTECTKRSVPGLPTYQPLAKLLQDGACLAKKTAFQSPEHMRVLVDAELVNAVRQYRGTDSASVRNELWSKYWERAVVRGREAMTLGYREVNEEGSDTPKGKEGNPRYL